MPSEQVSLPVSDADYLKATGRFIARKDIQIALRAYSLHSVALRN